MSKDEPRASEHLKDHYKLEVKPGPYIIHGKRVDFTTISLKDAHAINRKGWDKLVPVSAEAKKIREEGELLPEQKVKEKPIGKPRVNADQLLESKKKSDKREKTLPDKSSTANLSG